MKKLTPLLLGMLLLIFACTTAPDGDAPAGAASDSAAAEGGAAPGAPSDGAPADGPGTGTADDATVSNGPSSAGTPAFQNGGEENDLTDNGETADSGAAPDAGGSGNGRRTGEPGSGAEIAATTADATGNATKTATGEIPTPPAIEARVKPERPLTGDVVSILLDTGNYDSVAYDFGAGFTENGTHVYEDFGVKNVIVAATVDDQTTAAELAFPVFGEATLLLEENTVQHDASWEPVIEADLDAEGEFDTIRIYENHRLIFEVPRPDEYLIPVPFTGEREFRASLHHLGQHVADVNPVTITGLNAPPEKPVYEGAQFIQSSPGERVSFSVASSDPNNDPVRYEVKFAPENAEFDQALGMFVWTPTAGQRGVYLLHFTAYDTPYGLASPFTQRGILVQ